jgi:hypothetical protein
VSLGEDDERYDIEILDGTNVRRTLSSTTSAVLYAAADELADFGALQSTLSVAIYQLSTTVGRGVATRATLTTGA